eukprot:2694596-Rhodomonas_salina.2
MAGARQLVGEIVSLSHQRGCGFMESLPGVSDVYMPLYVCNGVTKGDIVSVEVLERPCGQNRWKVTRVLEIVSSSNLEGSFDDKCLVDKVVSFVARKGGEILVSELFDLFVVQPQIYRAVKASGGVQEYCRKDSRLKFFGDEKLESSGIKILGSAASEQQRQPRTQAPTLDRSSSTRHTNDEVESVLKSLENKLVLKQAGDNPRSFHDVLTTNGSSHRMESWPTLGAASSQVAGATTETRHDDLFLQQATQHAGCKGAARQADAQLQGAAEQAARSSGGPAAWASVAKSSGKTSGQKPRAIANLLKLAGKVSSIGRQGHAFMESAEEVVDVCVPCDLLQSWPQSVDVGDSLIVLAEEHRSGSNKYKATSILE